MKSGKEIALNAMKKELKVLSIKADKAKAEFDEYMRVGSELLAINDEFKKVLKSNDSDLQIASKLKVLQRRKDLALRVSKKDLLTLIGRESDARIELDLLNSEIENMEWTLKRSQ